MNQPLFAETDPRPRYWEALAAWGVRYGLGTWQEKFTASWLARCVEDWKTHAPDVRAVTVGPAGVA